VSKQPRIFTLTEEQQETAIELASRGCSLNEIIGTIVVTEYGFLKAREHNPEFEARFQSARLEGLEHIADDLIDIADEYADVQRARLKSENMKWLLSKRKPQIYGDKLDVNVTQQVDIATALNEAKKRALPQSERDVTDTSTNVIQLETIVKSHSENEN